MSTADKANDVWRYGGGGGGGGGGYGRGVTATQTFISSCLRLGLIQSLADVTFQIMGSINIVL